MRWIIQSSMKFQFLVIMVAIIIMVFGVTQLRGMPVDVLPEFSPPFVEIQTEALGLSAIEMEQMITVPMEQDLLAGVAWLDVIRSETVPGLSSVLIFFEPGTDLYRARQMVSERLAQSAVGLPHVSKPPTMIQPLSSASRFIIIGLSSRELSLIEMSVLARWTIAPRLMGVPGVAHVAIWGQRDRQLQVLIDPEQLQDQKVSLDQVIETTGNALWVSSLSYLEASSPGTGGFIDTPNQRLVLWHVLPISSPEELAQVPVEGTDGLLLGDVAEVVEDHQPLIGDAVINDDHNLMIVIEKLPGINTLEVTHGVETALAALQPGLPGIEFDASLYRPASFIEMAITNLARTLVISALFIVLILGLFLYGWRTALISLVTIIMSLVAALVVLYLRGVTLNALVLAGLVIALGVVVDDGIVDIENIIRRLRQNRQADNPKPTGEIILAASWEMRQPLFFASLIILLAIIPIFFLGGNAGALFRPMATSFALAVIAAMVAAFTITPALSVILLSNPRFEKRTSPLIPGLQRGYERILNWTLRRPWLALTISAVLAVVSLAISPFLKQVHTLPAFQESYLTIQLEGSPATSNPAMERIVARMSSELRTIPGVQNVGAHIGRAVFGDQVVGINSAELWVGLDPKADRETTAAAVQDAVAGYPGLDSQVQTYYQQILGQSELNTNNDITLRLFGEELSVLKAEAEKLEQTLAGLDGIVDSELILPVEEPTVEIEVDLDIAQKYGIKPGDVRRTAATLLSGLMVGSLFEEQKVFDVVVWGVPRIRNSLTDIEELQIQTPDGGVIRLGEVAKVRIVASPTVIQRESVSRYLDIHINVAGRNASAVIRDIETAVHKNHFPLEYHAEVLSDYAERQKSQNLILITGIVAALGIFLLIQASCRSWFLALMAFLTFLATLAGGVLVAFFNQGTLSLSALFGLIAVLGIGVRNGLMLINHYQQLELQEGSPFGQELVLQGSRERMVPILMTAMATGLVLLPFVLFRGLPGHEMVYPAAIIILGGLISSTLLNLFVMPPLYLRFGTSRESDLGISTQ